MENPSNVLLRPLDPFAFLARCLSIAAAVAAALTAHDFLLLLGAKGLVDPSLSHNFDPTRPLSLFPLVPIGSRLLNPLLIAMLNGVAISAVVLFWKPRSLLSSVALYISFTAFRDTAMMVTYGVHQYIQIGLFYVLIANAVTRIEAGSGGSATRDSVRWVGLLARIHLTIAYLFSGLCKAVGPDWWSGESMWRAIGRSDVSGQRLLDLKILGAHPLVLQGIGIVVVLGETFYFLAFFPKLRRYVVGALVFIHLATALTQGLILFAFVMISLNIFFLLDSRGWEDKPATVALGAIMDL